MTDSNGSVQVALVMSKTKVAPNKRLTIPRLELCSAHLLADLLYHIKQVFNIPVNWVYVWTDSTIVLSWLVGDPRCFKTFVNNRVARTHCGAYWIQTLESHELWRESGRLWFEETIPCWVTPTQSVVEWSQVVEAGIIYLALTNCCLSSRETRWRRDLPLYCDSQESSSHSYWQVLKLHLFEAYYGMDIPIYRELLCQGAPRLTSIPYSKRDTQSRALVDLTRIKQVVCKGVGVTERKSRPSENKLFVDVASFHGLSRPASCRWSWAKL